MDQPIAIHLAENLRQLREARGQSQEQCARLSGVPRPTWATLESGSANPTLGVLVKVAGALQVSIEELISPPRPSAVFFTADSLPIRKRGSVRVRRLLPEPLAGLEIERLEFAPGGQMPGIPHTQGTREYLTCEIGSIQLSAGGEHWELGPGDVVVFPGDQRHAYRNTARGRSIAYSIVALAPIGR